jgi:hypothetical protein
MKSEKLSAYATISLKFCYAIERRTFRIITVKSTDLPRFELFFKSPRRRNNLHGMYYHAVLPEYAEKYCARYEREKDFRINNEAYTTAIKLLFKVFARWEEESGGAENPLPFNYAGITLDLRSYSPTDTELRPNINEHRILRSRMKREDIFEARYRRSYLKILDPNSIPSLQTVKSFQVYSFDDNSYGTRLVEPASIANLASRMPKLERVSWSVSDNEKWHRYTEARQERRYRK